MTFLPGRFVPDARREKSHRETRGIAKTASKEVRSKTNECSNVGIEENVQPPQP